MKNKTNDYQIDTITYSLDDGETIDISNINLNDFSNYSTDIASMWPADMNTDTLVITSGQCETVTVDSQWHPNFGDEIDFELSIDKTPTDKVEHAELKLSGVCPACRCKLPDHEWNCAKNHESMTITLDSNNTGIDFSYYDENNMWTDVTQFTTINTHTK